MHTFDTTTESIIEGLFQVVSIGTTTGFVTAEYYSWPDSCRCCCFSPASSAAARSTGSGIKVIRVLLLVKQGQRELRRLVYPVPRLRSRSETNRCPKIDRSGVGIFRCVFALFGLMILLLMATGLDQVTAFSAVAATINNLLVPGSVTSAVTMPRCRTSTNCCCVSPCSSAASRSSPCWYC